MYSAPNSPKRKKGASEFKRAYLTGLPPDLISKQIYPCTRSSCKNKSPNNLYGYDFIYAIDEQMDFYQWKDRYDKRLKVTKSLALVVGLTM